MTDRTRPARRTPLAPWTWKVLAVAAILLLAAVLIWVWMGSEILRPMVPVPGQFTQSTPTP